MSRSPRRTRVKICCISSLDEARMAVDAGADALGFVAARQSGPGFVDDAAIRAIERALEVGGPVDEEILHRDLERMERASPF